VRVSDRCARRVQLWMIAGRFDCNTEFRRCTTTTWIVHVVYLRFIRTIYYIIVVCVVTTPGIARGIIYIRRCHRSTRNVTISVR